MSKKLTDEQRIARDIAKREYNRVWHLQNRDRLRGSRRENQKKYLSSETNYAIHREDLWRRHGIIGLTYQFFLETLKLQDHRCVICGKTIDKDTGHADHDHESGTFRGIACGSCNRMIGLAQDSVSVLENAASYLRRHSKIGEP